MKFTSIAISHIGRRPNNEDAFLAHDELGLYLVADGMGGYEGGEVASRLAVSSVLGFVRENADDHERTWPHALDHALSFDENLARVAVRVAHERIAAQRVGRLAKMGSTLACLLVRGDHATVVAHIGDSRVYRWRRHTLTQLTRDHSLYEELAAAGSADLPAREDFPYSNMITRALGISGEADSFTVRPAPGDRYLLCTDGLTERVGDRDIARILASAALEPAGHQLVQSAYDAGAHDNITVVLVECTA